MGGATGGFKVLSFFTDQSSCDDGERRREREGERVEG